MIGVGEGYNLVVMRNPLSPNEFGAPHALAWGISPFVFLFDAPGFILRRLISGARAQGFNPGVLKGEV
jgi:hypothetical protein